MNEAWSGPNDAAPRMQIICPKTIVVVTCQLTRPDLRSSERPLRGSGLLRVPQAWAADPGAKRARRVELVAWLALAVNGAGVLLVWLAL